MVEICAFAVSSCQFPGGGFATFLWLQHLVFMLVANHADNFITCTVIIFWKFRITILQFLYLSFEKGTSCVWIKLPVVVKVFDYSDYVFLRALIEFMLAFIANDSD
jgi:hypothetical protein